jgi:hypothetical protein
LIEEGGRPALVGIPDISKQTPHPSPPYSKLGEDYAIVARYLDQTTGQLVVVAAGIGGNGTISAGEFLTDRKFLAQLVEHAPKDWARKNVEAVIATQVIDGKSGPPRVVAVHFW